MEWNAPTCANKHDIIQPVLRLNTIHHYLFQLIRNVGLYKHRATKGWIHRPPHQRVVAGKLQDWIGEVLCAPKLPARLIDDFTGALERYEGDKKDIEKQRKREKTNDYSWYSIHRANFVWLTDGPFKVKKVEWDMDRQTESRQKEEI